MSDQSMRPDDGPDQNPPLRRKPPRDWDKTASTIDDVANVLKSAASVIFWGLVVALIFVGSKGCGA